MACLRVLKYAALFVIMQVCTQVIALPPKDTITRKGIIIQMYTEADCKKIGFLDEVIIDGYSFVKSGTNRDKEIFSGMFLAIIQRYNKKTMPSISYDFLVVTYNTGINSSKFAAGALLYPLKVDTDLDDAIIMIQHPLSLEFVMSNKQCLLMNLAENVPDKTYYCGNDNFLDYAYRQW